MDVILFNLGGLSVTLAQVAAGCVVLTLLAVLALARSVSRAHGARLGFAGHLDAVKSAQTVRENLFF